MKIKNLNIFAFCALTSSHVLAEPSVNGLTISWPDNGWYQVQDANTFQEVCGGGRSCLVSPGRYIVINHSSGERFENVEVGNDNSIDAIQVNGLTISWPDDGWYQVLDSSNFQEVCGGGRSCLVSPGRYIVINHSTGERFENIQVSHESANNAIEVNGLTISWPDNGWYQVQDSTNFQEVCGGGRSCLVSPGNYVVINHTTGERFENIQVGDGTTHQDAIINTNNYSVILRNIRDLFSGELYQSIFNDIEFIETETIGRTFLGSSGTNSDRVDRYACEGNGGVDVFTSGGAQTLSTQTTATHCLIAGKSYSGTSSLAEVFGNPSTFRRIIEDYIVVDQNGYESEFSAERNGTTESPQALSDTLIVSSFESEQSGVSVREASTSVDVNFQSGQRRGFFSAEITSEWTGNEPLRLTTTEAFSFPSTQASNSAVYYESGVLEATAADGSQLTIDASGGSPSTFTVTISAQGSVTSLSVAWDSSNTLPCYDFNDLGSSECRFAPE